MIVIKTNSTLWLYAINNLYYISITTDGIPDLFDSQLQREYMAQVSYPNHQVERKAQRSPSLRLRFGRRSDPGLLPIQVYYYLVKQTEFSN